MLLFVRTAGAIIDASDPRANQYDDSLGTLFHFPNIEFEKFKNIKTEIDYKMGIINGLIISHGACRASEVDINITSFNGNHTRTLCTVSKISSQTRHIISEVTEELYVSYINGSFTQKEIKVLNSLMTLISYIDPRASIDCYYRPISVCERYGFYLNTKRYYEAFAILYGIKVFGVCKTIYSNSGDRLYDKPLHQELLDIEPEWLIKEVRNDR